jgi:hypothetical protein
MTDRRLIWAVAIAVTLVSAVFQRMTGPTYPVRGSVTIGGQSVAIKLARTHAGAGGQPVGLTVQDHEVTGAVAWRRYPTNDDWQTIPLIRTGDRLDAELPHQPVAGKLEFQVRLQRGTTSVAFPAKPAVTRFRNDVPAYVLLPHVSAMFFAMLFLTAAGLSAFTRSPQARREAYIGMTLLGVGGFLLGPLMQRIAFGAWWTGVPFGWDLTDNKTLIAGVAWLVAWARMRGGRDARVAIIAASLVTLVIFAIPHSVWGSELTWTTVRAGAPQ